LSHGGSVEVGLGNGDHVVATDDCRLGETLVLSHFHFGWDPSNGPRDWRTGDTVEQRDRGIAGEDADRPFSRWRSQISPDDVVSSYQRGAVSEARRLEVSMRSGSGGYLV
jgi:hypothetical protein